MIFNGLLAIIACIPVWVFRYFPLRDLPVWLFEIKTYGAYQRLGLDRFYEIAHFPVPKLIFNLSVYWLNSILPLTIAAKIMITVALLAPPLGIIYLFRSSPLGAKRRPLETIGFLFCYNRLFFTGLFDYLIGLGLYLFLIGFLLRRKAGWALRESLVIFFGTVLLYLSHLFPYMLFCLTLALFYFFDKTFSKKCFSKLPLLLLPTVFLTITYFLTYANFLKVVSYGSWGLKLSALVTLFTPYCKFYPFDNPLPTCFLNLCLFSIFILLLAVLFIQNGKRLDYKNPFFILSAVFMCLAVVLPAEFDGSAGVSSRFGYPIYIFFLLSFASLPPVSPVFLKRTISVLFVFCVLSSCVSFYYVGKKVRKELEQQLVYLDPGKKICQIFEYFSKYPLKNRLTPGVQLDHSLMYLYLDKGGVTRGIFGTSLLKLGRNYPDTLQEFFGIMDDAGMKDLQDNAENFKAYDNIVIRGRVPRINVIEGFFAKDFRVVYRDENLIILRNNLSK